MTSVKRDRERVLSLLAYIMGATKRNSILFLLILQLIILALLRADGMKDVAHYYKLAEWDTVGALTGIMIITTGIRESNFLGKVAKRILNRPMSERKLALLLILISALLSTFLTNDITLFIVVPLTLGLQARLENDITKMVIFEIVAVNVGSSLTPVGNPQNLFLWHNWELSFTAFMVKMMPLAAVLMLLLLLFVWLSFKMRVLKVSAQTNDHCDGRLVALSLALLCGYMVTFELKQTAYALPITVPADPDVLKEVLFNLVDNAVQHTKMGGSITLGWRSCPGAVEMWVADDGEGIASEHLPHIFEPFYRGDTSRSRRRGGTGLGLTLARALVKAHEGHITVESQVGQGTCFTITLPTTQEGI